MAGHRFSPGMTVASIDIGTNTILLLIAEVGPSGEIIPLTHEQRIPRLGKGVDARKRLHPDSIRRAVDVLRDYKQIIAKHAVDRVVVVGTSAVRDALNTEELAAAVKNETGFELEILSGNEEAHWTFRGAISGVPASGNVTVLDIGGGSTEITTGDRRGMLGSISLDIGSVRLTERCFRSDPPTSAHLAAATDIVRNHLEQVHQLDFRDTALIAVAGTATSLAILHQGLPEFNLKAVTNYRLTLPDVQMLFERLSTMPSTRIRQLSAVMEGRADVITAGALILREVMQHFRFPDLIVSERGVRYGLVLREWEKLRETDVGGMG